MRTYAFCLGVGLCAGGFIAFLLYGTSDRNGVLAGGACVVGFLLAACTVRDVYVPVQPQPRPPIYNLEDES